MDFTNPPNSVIRDILARPLTIAVAICSTNPTRDSHRIAGRLQAYGYRIIPVNPAAAGETIHGETCYATLADIPDAIDMVDVFRRASHIDPIVDDVPCARFSGCNSAASTKSNRPRPPVSRCMDRCTSREYRRLIRRPHDVAV